MSEFCKHNTHESHYCGSCIQESFDLRIKNATPEELMQSELVRELVREVNNILYIGQCLCDRGYTSRNLHEPNTYCGQLDDLQDAVKKFEVTDV